MKATEAKAGKLYRVTKVPAWEYLTKGEIYKSDGFSQNTVGFHRPTDGGGTYLTGTSLTAVEIEEVQS